jgi:ABC-2 type transport system ATP-binding protein
LPTAGKIRYFGKDFAKHRQASLQRINYASAYNSLQFRISVEDNLRVFAGLYGVRKPKQKIAELLDYFEIRRLANEKYRNLSAGEKTRVNLIKALLNDPELILMDEPTASLDPDIADKVLELIEKLRAERQLAILFTSHNMSEVERVCDRVAFLNKGEIVSLDTPQNHTKQLKEVVLRLRIAEKRQAAEAVLREQGLTFTNPETQVLEIKTTAARVGRIIGSITAEDIPIHDIDLQKPDLKDVFLEIARMGRS